MSTNVHFLKLTLSHKLQRAQQPHVSEALSRYSDPPTRGFQQSENNIQSLVE